MKEIKRHTLSQRRIQHIETKAITIRLPVALLEKIRLKAFNQRKSINYLIQEILNHSFE